MTKKENESFTLEHLGVKCNTLVKEERREDQTWFYCIQESKGVKITQITPTTQPILYGLG